MALEQNYRSENIAGKVPVRFFILFVTCTANLLEYSILKRVKKHYFTDVAICTTKIYGRELTKFEVVVSICTLEVDRH